MTSLTLPEFDKLCLAFAATYEQTYPADRTQEGPPRQRNVGGGRIGQLEPIEDKLLFILTYHKTYPTQTVQGQLFGLSQSQAHDWIHRLMPLLQRALARLGYAPKRDPLQVRKYKTAKSTPAQLMIDGTERRRQRPKQAEKQVDFYSGKKKHTSTRTSYSRRNKHNK